MIFFALVATTLCLAVVAMVVTLVQQEREIRRLHAEVAHLRRTLSITKETLRITEGNFRLSEEERKRQTRKAVGLHHLERPN